MTFDSFWEISLQQKTGGLTEIGISLDAEYLLVVSHSGRGVYKIDQNIRVARDYNEPKVDSDWIDDKNHKVKGIGPISSESIKTVGLWGGKLETITKDGWQLKYNGSSIKAIYFESNEEWTINEPITEVRAFGFSNNGKYLVIATSDEVLLYRRKPV